MVLTVLRPPLHLSDLQDLWCRAATCSLPCHPAPTHLTPTYLQVKIQEGVVFLTYSSLISSSDRGLSRLRQLTEWCGPDFDGLIVFDESEWACS